MGLFGPDKIDGETLEEQGYSAEFIEWIDGREVESVKNAFSSAHDGGGEINHEWANMMKSRYGSEFADAHDSEIAKRINEMLEEVYYSKGETNGLTTDGHDPEFIDADGEPNALPGQENQPEAEGGAGYFKGNEYDPMRGTPGV